jgi:beta-lactamase regulating signal transducer with metallopeptidase domain
MSTLLEIALSNLAMAAVLAVPAALAGWWGRRPALTHGLWLLVLLKLVTPPIYQVPIAVFEPPAEAVAPVQVARETAAAPIPEAPEPIAGLPAEPPTGVPDLTPAPLPDWPAVEPEVQVPVDPAPMPPAPVDAVVAPGRPWLVAGVLTWLAGGVLWLLLAIGRLMRFQRLLRHAETAPAPIQGEAQRLAEAMGVHCPQVLLLPGTISPMLWAMGGTPRLLVPAGLLDRLRPGQQATLLAHELAHWRRGDHRIRWLEVMVLALYWWCPFVWWARRQLHQAEEECCDAWVVALLPEAARDYALTLVDTIDFLSGAPHLLPPVASGVGHVRLLQRRLTMILRGATPQSLTRRGLLLLAGLGLVLLPFVPSLAQQPANRQPDPPGIDDALRNLKDLLTKNAEAEAIRAIDLGRLAALAQQGQVPVEQAQRELEAKRAELQRQLDQLHQAVEQLKQAAKTAAKAGARRETTPMPPGNLPKVSGGRGSGVGGMPMMPGMPGMGGMPGMPGMGGAPPGARTAPPGQGGSMEQRLEQVEKKLDILIWEITNLRRDMGKGHAQGQSGMTPGGRFGSGGSTRETVTEPAAPRSGTGRSAAGPGSVAPQRPTRAPQPPSTPQAAEPPQPPAAPTPPQDLVPPPQAPPPPVPTTPRGR